MHGKLLRVAAPFVSTENEADLKKFPTALRGILQNDLVKLRKKLLRVTALYVSTENEAEKYSAILCKKYRESEMRNFLEQKKILTMLKYIK